MTLAEIRVNIDRVDKQIKELFQERMGLADEVARVKAETGDTILKPERESAIITKLTEGVPQNIVREYTAIIKRIMEVSRKYQYGRTLELRNCLGLTWETEEPEVHTVSMIKPEVYICPFVSKDSVIPCDSFEEVGNSVVSSETDAGIGILENLSVSTSDELHLMLLRKGLYINRCTIIAENGLRKKVVLFSSKLVVKPDNNRIKIMFVCPNRSGALASILSMISDYGINLTEIHSRPNQEKDWNYEFYAEIEGNLLNKETQALIYQLENEALSFRILGSYTCNGDF